MLWLNKLLLLLLRLEVDAVLRRVADEVDDADDEDDDGDDDEFEFK